MKLIVKSCKYAIFEINSKPSPSLRRENPMIEADHARGPIVAAQITDAGIAYLEWYDGRPSGSAEPDHMEAFAAGFRAGREERNALRARAERLEAAIRAAISEIDRGCHWDARAALAASEGA
jgi:hypothetical protein